MQPAKQQIEKRGYWYNFGIKTRYDCFEAGIIAGVILGIILTICTIQLLK